jgi:Arc/MetJ-type ribon-helix-helix transcriptional regulator
MRVERISKMKQKISITLDKEVLDTIENLVKNNSGAFRNRSHVIEYSIKRLLENKKKKLGGVNHVS